MGVVAGVAVGVREEEGGVVVVEVVDLVWVSFQT